MILGLLYEPLNTMMWVLNKNHHFRCKIPGWIEPLSKTVNLTHNLMFLSLTKTCFVDLSWVFFTKYSGFMANISTFLCDNDDFGPK